MPTVNDEVARVAVPLVNVAAAPKLVPPSLNCTVPLGVPAPGATAETVAVNVTDWPETEGFTEDETLVKLPA